MHSILTVAAFLFQAPAPPTAMAVLETMASRQGLREATVDNYTIIESYTGLESPQFFEKTMINGLPLFRVVPIEEWQARNPRNSALPARAIAGAMGPALQMMTRAMGPELDGYPGGAMVAGYLSDFADQGALFLRAAAAAPPASDGRAEAASERSGLELFASMARLIGRETVEEPPVDATAEAPSVRDAFLLRADGLADVLPAQSSEAGTFIIERISTWIDAMEYVQLRLVIDGRLEQKGKSTPISIELRNQHHQPAGPLLVPMRKVMRIAGLMDADPKQRREFEKAKAAADKAKADMARMRSQLAQMPAAQRRMIENKMGSMLAQLDQMTASGTIEVVVNREVLGVNQGPPFDWVPKPVMR